MKGVQKPQVYYAVEIKQVFTFQDKHDRNEFVRTLNTSRMAICGNCATKINSRRRAVGEVFNIIDRQALHAGG